MTDLDIKISAKGCIRLGKSVSCDGFLRESPIRVQTHVHTDHMSGFDRSKAFQTIVASRGTHALLCAKRNADLPYRTNFVGLEFGVPLRIDDVEVLLESSGHMMGAAQVLVTYGSGLRVGYSGDFSWPLEKVISADVLVVDPTYGSPRSVREYSQGEAEEALLDAIRAALNAGPVRLSAFQGTLQRALQVITGEIDVPIVGSETVVKEANVYREFGFAIDEVTDVRSDEGRAIVRSGRFVQVYGTGDSVPVSDGKSTVIKLSAYMVQPDNPVLKFGDRSMKIALTDHADFSGTLDYIASTGAGTVVVDSSRGEHAVNLAQEVRSRLGITCVVPEVDLSYEWGH